MLEVIQSICDFQDANSKLLALWVVLQPHNNFANLDWRSPPLFWNDWSLWEQEGAPGPGSTSSCLLSSSFLDPPPPPSHTSYSFPACSVFPPSLPLLLCHNSSPPLSARLSPSLFVPEHEKEHHDATTLSVLFVLISKVTTPIIFCRSSVFVQFLCFFWCQMFLLVLIL